MCYKIESNIPLAGRNLINLLLNNVISEDGKLKWEGEHINLLNKNEA